MKLLRISYEWPPPWAGLVPHPYELTRAQAELGNELIVFCGRWPFTGPIETLPNVKITSFIREPVRGTIAFTTSILLFFYYLLWRHSAEGKSINIIHSHGHFAIWIYLYRFILSKVFPWSKELKTPVVVHFHNTTEGRWQALKEKGEKITWVSQKIAWPASRFADKLAIKTAKAYIFVNESVKEEAQKYYGVDETKCFVVESGVNTKLFAPVVPEEKEKTRKDLGFDLQDRVIVNHGFLVERKNIHLLVEALKFLPSFYKLILSGPFGSKEFEEKVEKLIADNNLKGRVVMTGYVPYPQSPIAYQAADIFVLPSSWEGTSKAVIESLACGVPAIVSGFRFSQDLQGLFYLGNVTAESIAQKIDEVYASDVRMDTSKIHSLFSWQTRAHKIQEIYDFVEKN